jgi:hypothetical protein
MLPDLTWLQWGCAAAIVALIVGPRLWSAAKGLGGLVAGWLGRSPLPQGPQADIHAAVDAFLVLRPYLCSEVACKVWVALDGEAAPPADGLPLHVEHEAPA